MANAIECNHTIGILDLEGNNISGSVQAKIQAIINDPNRMRIPNNKVSSLEQLEAFIKKKDEEIRKRDKVLVSKDELIASYLASPVKFIEKVMTKKNSNIASLKSSLKYSKRVEIVNLNSELAEPTSKRPRTDDTS